MWPASGPLDVCLSPVRRLAEFRSRAPTSTLSSEHELENSGEHDHCLEASLDNLGTNMTKEGGLQDFINKHGFSVLLFDSSLICNENLCTGDVIYQKLFRKSHRYIIKFSSFPYYYFSKTDRSFKSFECIFTANAFFECVIYFITQKELFFLKIYLNNLVSIKNV